MRKPFFILSLLMLLSAPAHALVINPSTGLTDYVFNFGGVGSSAFFGSDPDLQISVATPSTIKIQVEDCCVAGDEFDDLYIDGVLTPWNIVEAMGGDGVANGAAVMGPGSTYFEAIATIFLSAGTHTIDLTQTAGIPGGTWINVSSARAAVPEPASLALMGLGFAGLAFARRRKS